MREFAQGFLKWLSRHKWMYSLFALVVLLLLWFAMRMAWDGKRWIQKKLAPPALSVRIAEGASWAQIQHKLKATPHLEIQSSEMTEAEIAQAVGLVEVRAVAGAGAAADGSSGQVLEGRFFPDTYFYQKGESDLAVLRRAKEAMDRRLEVIWEERALGLPYAAPQELLTLASLIERETALARDRPMVAAVFVNRLRLGMPLQSDPTVLYAKRHLLSDMLVHQGSAPNWSTPLSKADLQMDSAYNTYTRTGLPPSPIAAPSLASLIAAGQPAQVNALYFVAKGDGSSHFSSTLPEHNAAVVKYILGGR